MGNFEPKKLALIRIWEILKEHSDSSHPLTQQDIAKHLEDDYGIVIERKAISRNISLLKEAGIEIESGRTGSYLESRDFEDSELRLLIDGILCSKYITAKYSSDLIDRLCSLSNKYFRSHLKNIHSVNDWNKTNNQSVFLNIEMIDYAIDEKLCIEYDYNKFGIDKKLHKSSSCKVSPYRLILNNQRYYLMANNELWGGMVFHRLDRITNMKISSDMATDVRSIPGYENGINYKQISSSMPYMFPGEPVRITFSTDVNIIDQIIDWFGDGIQISEVDNVKAKVSIMASIDAMKYWALQYLDYVEIIEPQSLRERIEDSIINAAKKYGV